MIQDAVKKLIRAAGFRIERISRYDGGGYHSRIVKSLRIPDLDIFSSAVESIPGMVEHDFGKMLYMLCQMQDISGNVVEVGSWQGRSTAYLAKAVADSQNGILFAIDHFRGNAGKEDLYRIQKPDLSDLASGFEKNMKRVDLWDRIKLLRMPTEQAALHIDNNVRFLFLYGDHSEEGVRKDIGLFFPFLVKRSIVVFHDFQKGFLGVVRAIEDRLKEVKPQRIFTSRSGLILMM